MIGAAFHSYCEMGFELFLSHLLKLLLERQETYNSINSSGHGFYKMLSASTEIMITH